MKKIVLLLFLSILSKTANAQIDGSLLLGLTEASTAEMLSISNPIEGALLYNSTEKRVYQYNGANWDQLEINESPIIAAKTSNYILTAADNGSVFTFNSNANVTLTASNGLPIGFNISIYQIGNGQVIITGSSGVTIKNRLSRFKTAGKDAGVGLICTANNIFHLTGDLKK